jgi:hypothetical protein
MHYPEKDNRLNEILQEIETIQSKPHNGWFTALGRQIKVDKLHAELDQMGYRGDRPPRSWSHFKVGKLNPK